MEFVSSLMGRLYPMPVREPNPDCPICGIEMLFQNKEERRNEIVIEYKCPICKAKAKQHNKVKLPIPRHYYEDEIDD